MTVCPTCRRGYPWRSPGRGPPPPRPPPAAGSWCWSAGGRSPPGCGSPCSDHPGRIAAWFRNIIMHFIMSTFCMKSTMRCFCRCQVSGSAALLSWSWCSIPRIVSLEAKICCSTCITFKPWNNGKKVPRWGVAEIQKMSPSTTGRCYCCH